MEQHAAFDQSHVFAFLANPATHGLSEPVIRIDTHGAAVFLAGEDVYKIKRAVRFSFMDFSTLDKRRWACERELAVNKANAPNFYLGLIPISRDGSNLKLGEGGTIVEWAVHMRRFDESRTLDRLASRNELDFTLMAKLAKVVAASHQRAAVASGMNAGNALQRQIEGTSSPSNYPSKSSRLRLSRVFARPWNSRLPASKRFSRRARSKVKSAAVMAIFTCAISS